MSAPSATDQAVDEPSDADLLAAHVGGDAEAFGVLFARHRNRLWAVALRTAGNPEDAEDALQEALIAAYRRAGSFRGEAKVSTWLHRVVVNACLDRIRARKVRETVPLPGADDDGDRGSLAVSGAGPLGPLGATGATGSPDAGDPVEHAVADERRRMVLAALATLPEEQRAALVLVDMEGYPVAEVAEMLDCAPGTVKSRCSRGRHRLADLLGVLAPGAEAESGNQEPASAVPPEHPGRAPPAAPRP